MRMSTIHTATAAAAHQQAVRARARVQTEVEQDRELKEQEHYTDARPAWWVHETRGFLNPQFIFLIS